MAYRLKELVEKFGGEFHGDGDCQVATVATLQLAGQGDITFLSNSAYRKFLPNTNASIVIIRNSDLPSCKGNAWVVDDPYVTYARVAQLLYGSSNTAQGVHPSAVVDSSCSVANSAMVSAQCYIGANSTIAENVYIGPGCVIEDDCSVGSDSRLVANVVVRAGTVIGERAILHPGVVLGADGFGFANDAGAWLKIPQIGAVEIGDDVEIGANTTVDRGALGNTVIEEGVKLDNQIQIAHNVHIGAHTAIVACTAIAGSTVIGKHCAIGGCVGIAGHLNIVDKVQITAMSFVINSIEKSGTYSSGIPAEENRQWRKNTVRIKKLEDYAQRLRRLEGIVNNKK